MATFLDIGLLQHLGTVFVMFLVFILVFGVLQWMKVFGDKKTLHAVMALFVSLLFLVSKGATLAIINMVPWFIVIAIFIFFTLFMIRVFGVTDSDIHDLIKDSSVYPFIIIFACLILAFALSSLFGQGLLEKGDPAGATSSSSIQGITVINGSQGARLAGNQQAYTLPETTSTQTENFGTNLLNTLRHPKVLGFILIMLIGAFVLFFLTKSVTRD